MKSFSLTDQNSYGIKGVMKRLGLALLVLSLIVLTACSSGTSGGFHIYYQGNWVNYTRSQIEDLLTTTSTSGFPNLEGDKWALDPLQASFYFAFDLLGLTQGNSYEFVTAGSGLTVLGPDRKPVAYYEEPQQMDPKSKTLPVALIVQDKGVWRIEASRLWDQGPWLITGLEKTK